MLTSCRNEDRYTMLPLVLTSDAATLIRHGKSVHLSLEAVVNRIPIDSKDDMDEQIYNPTVHINGELGVALTLYVFYGDGKLNNVGTDMLNMWKAKDRGCAVTGIADIWRELDEKAFEAFGRRKPG